MLEDKNIFTDTFRYMNPELRKYSCWSMKTSARKNNYGSRIDYFLTGPTNNFTKKCVIASNVLDTKLREDLERLKKIRSHRGLRHYWGLRVRG